MLNREFGRQDVKGFGEDEVADRKGMKP